MLESIGEFTVRDCDQTGDQTGVTKLDRNQSWEPNWQLVGAPERLEFDVTSNFCNSRTSA